MMIVSCGSDNHGKNTKPLFGGLVSTGLEKSIGFIGESHKEEQRHPKVDYRCSSERSLMDSKYLEFNSNGDGTCCVSGIVFGKKNVAKGDLYIPIISPEGDIVTSVGYDAFRNCGGLTAVYLPDTVTTIGEWAFKGCTSLKNITIPEGVTTIKDWAFDGCISLKSVTIPKSVKRIGERAFADAEEVYTFVKRKPIRWAYNFTYAPNIHWAK